MSATVSVCLIVKNEEEYLKTALKSVSPFAHEIIIVDTGSTDTTIEIARSFACAKIFNVLWNNDFSEARNISLQKASGDWLFILDADETISSRDTGTLRNITATVHDTAYSFVTRNYLKPNTLPGCIPAQGEYEEEKGFFGWIASDKVRLFPNHRGIYFENIVHEIVEPSLIKQKIPIARCDIPVHHFGFNREESCRKAKGDMHLTLLHKQCKLTPDNPKCYFDIGFILFGKKKYQEAIPFFESALEKKEGYTEALFFLSQSYGEIGDNNRAIKMLQKLLTHDPLFNEALYALGNIFLKLKDTKQAQHYYERLSELNPHHPEVFFKLGVIAQDKGELKNARDYFVKAKKNLKTATN